VVGQITPWGVPFLEGNETNITEINLTQVNNSKTNITLPDNENDLSITLPEENISDLNFILSENLTDFNQTIVNDTIINKINSPILFRALDFLIHAFAEGAIYLVEMFTLGAQGRVTGGAIYDARFLLTGTQIGNPNAIGSVYTANIGFVSPSNGKTVTRGDTLVSFVVKLENIGGGNATNISFYMDIPEEWGVISGGENNTNGIVVLDSGFNLSVGQSVQKVLEVSIPNDATVGDFTLYINSTGFNESNLLIPDNRLVGDFVVVAVNEIYVSPVSPPSPPSGGGGGGASYVTPRCDYNWRCDTWSPCINGEQTRTCIDLKNCSGEKGKPNEFQKCSITGALFNIDLEIEEKRIGVDELVSAKINIINLGISGNFNVIIDYIITNSFGDIVYEEEKIESINLERGFTEEFEFSKSTGEYLISANLTYIGQQESAFAEDRFLVVGGEGVFAPYVILERAGISRGIGNFLGILFLTGLIFTTLVFRALKRRHKKLSETMVIEESNITKIR